MDETALSVYTFLTILLIFIIHKLTAGKRYNLPSTPAAELPVIGHLHLLKPPIHRTFHRFSQISGPIFSLKLGVRRCVVVSSPDLAEECFSKLDTILANRPQTLAGKHISYNYDGLVPAPYGDHWRSLRRIAAQELFSSARLNSFLHIRRYETDRLLLSLLEASRRSSRVELRPVLSELTLNSLTRMIAGESFSGELTKTEHGLSKLINDVMELSQVSNAQDFLPFLQWIDFGGYKKKLTYLGRQFDEFLQSLIDDHRRHNRNTMIGHLLSLLEFCSDQTIKALILSTLVAGTDTSSVTIEWAMSNLVNNPNVLVKAREELDATVGFERLMNEEDLSNLPYLNSIILETFRLFPAAPLLLPHVSSKDCKLGGYDIPKNTILFVNAWEIHRDPTVWEDASDFKPERFEGVSDVGANKFLMPFGLGRRACPGSSLGKKLVGLGLGSMIQCFEWERVGLEGVDLGEGEGLTMPKLEPLQAMCKPREMMRKVMIK